MRLAAAIFCLVLSASTSQAIYVPPGLNSGDHYHLVFATSFISHISSDTSVPPPFPYFGGVTAADYLITEAAASSGYIPNWNSSDITWKAILSTTSQAAPEHINVQGPVYNTHGELVANDSADLWDGTIAHAIKYDERGGRLPVNYGVWTGTNSLGHTSSQNAGDWTDTTKVAATGDPNATDAGWVSGGAVFGTGSARFYGISPLLTVPLLGDYNNNGVVDQADYAIWRHEVAAGPGSGIAADGNYDGVVDARDYDVWRSHFGQVMTGSGATFQGATVPEPTSAALVAFAAMLFGMQRSRKRSI